MIFPIFKRKKPFSYQKMGSRSFIPLSGSVQTDSVVVLVYAQEAYEKLKNLNYLFLRIEYPKITTMSRKILRKILGVHYNTT
jgi:hypothetical protein